MDSPPPHPLPTLPFWKRWPRHLRGRVTLLGVLLSSAVTDLWLRLWVLPTTRGNLRRRKSALNRMVRFWGRTELHIASRCLRLRLAVKGSPPRSGRYLVVSNHQSVLDGPVLISVLGQLNIKFAAIQELFQGKLAVSLLLRESGSWPIPKTDPTEDLIAFHRFGTAMEAFEGSPTVFPEGGRCVDGAMQSFRVAGVEAVRRTARLPILPVVLDGLWPGRTLFECHRLYGATITVWVGAPISVEEAAADPRAAYRKLEATMRRALEELRGAGEGSGGPGGGQS